ncbi:MAG TPA: hypothetical protein VHQ43_00510 [Solirubrobacterales bacterium]|nr:hypothetical protein [Solirubrobacterales bacterium]
MSVVGAADGSRAAAAALACAASEPDRAALLIDLDADRTPRPSLVATGGARALEERLAAHLPDAGVASRGSICQLQLAPDEDGVGQIAAALPLVRDSAAVAHLPPALFQPALDDPHVGASAVLLRADLDRDRALVALAARDAMARDLRVAVLKRPLGRLTARRALLGALPPSSRVLPPRIGERLLQTAGG